MEGARDQGEQFRAARRGEVEPGVALRARGRRSSPHRDRPTRPAARFRRRPSGRFLEPLALKYRWSHSVPCRCAGPPPPPPYCCPYPCPYCTLRSREYLADALVEAEDARREALGHLPQQRLPLLRRAPIKQFSQRCARPCAVGPPRVAGAVRCVGCAAAMAPRAVRGAPERRPGALPARAEALRARARGGCARACAARRRRARRCSRR